MSDIGGKRKQIEQKIDEWGQQGLIYDVSNKRLPDGEIISMRIQHSGCSFNIYFNGKMCKVVCEDNVEHSKQFEWRQNDVVEILSYIEQLLVGC